MVRLHLFDDLGVGFGFIHVVAVTDHRDWQLVFIESVEIMVKIWVLEVVAEKAD